jgi:hypothetical protein
VTLGNVRRGVCLAPHFHCKRTVPRFSVELPVFYFAVKTGRISVPSKSRAYEFDPL